MGNPDAAIAHHEVAIDIETRASGEGGIRLAVFQAGYGNTLAAGEHYAEALPILEQAYRVLSPQFGDEHPRVQGLAKALADLNEQLDDVEASARWRELVVESDSDR